MVINTWDIEDDSIDPPVVGDIGEYPIIFFAVEDVAHSDDTAVVDIEATATVTGSSYIAVDGLRRWPTVYSGPGWRYEAHGTAPVNGPVRLHGTFHANHMGTPDVRGRVIRVRIESVEMRLEPWPGDPGGRQAWRPIPGTIRHRDVGAAPRRYDDETPTPGGSRFDWAVIVDLDLTDPGESGSAS